MPNLVSAKEKIRESLKELYGDERVLIVRNTTNGVVSIGFGETPKDAAVGGKWIPRSKLPIVLTEELAPDVWLKSNDFRAAVSKGWLEIVSKEEYQAEMSIHNKRQAELERAAAKDNFKGLIASDANITQLENPGEDSVIDEETAQLKPASQDINARRFMEYEGIEVPGRPKETTEPGITVIGADVSSRAVSLVEATKRGSITPLDALNQLDTDEKLMQNSDLNFIASSAGYDSIRSQARGLLAARLK